jgi:integrase
MPLTDLQVRAAKPEPGKIVKLPDGHGLTLWIAPSGLKTWRLYVFVKDQDKPNGRSRAYIGKTLGHWPDMGIKEARRAAALAREDVIGAAEAKAQAKEQADAAGASFGAVKAQWLDQVERSHAAANTIDKARWLCEQMGPLEPLPIQEIEAPAILALLKPWEAHGKLETAARLKSTISRIFRFAAAHGLAKHDPTALLKGALIPPKPKHRAALVERDAFAGLMRAVANYQEGKVSILRDALMLLALTAARPGELRCADWAEFDLDRAEWTVPAARMKMRSPHRAPLSTAACDILRRLADENGRIRPASPYILPGPRPGRPLSENAFNAALRAMGYGKDDMSAHGFRSSFSTLANQSGLWPYDAIERQLAHQDTSDVRRAYHRADYFDERRRLVEWWGREISAMISTMV